MNVSRTRLWHTLRLPGEFLISHDSMDLDSASCVSQLKQSMLVIRMYTYTAFPTLERESGIRACAFHACWGNNADLSTCVYEETHVANTIPYVKKATRMRWAGDTCRR